MEDIKIFEYKEIDLSNSMLVVAFPTVGLISSIAGNFIVKSLKLKEIGLFFDYALMSQKPARTVLWITLFVTAVSLGGVMS